jgi:hypothetical protein
MGRLIGFAVLLATLLFAPGVFGQDNPAGANALGADDAYTAYHSTGNSEGPPRYLRALELRGWPQGSHRAMSDDAIRARAAAALARLSVACDIGDVLNPGVTGDRKQVFEVACRNGPGLLITEGAPPQVVNCLQMTAWQKAREAAGEKVSHMCLLPANRDAAPALAAAVATLDPACTVDEAAWIGRVGEDQDRYEVGCAGRDGFWIQTQLNEGRVRDSFSCLEVANHDQTCRYTSPDEQLATVVSRLSDGAPSCDGEAARYLGRTGDGAYYELKCREASGFIFRTTAGGAFDQAWPCARATAIAGGCRLGVRSE